MSSQVVVLVRCDSCGVAADEDVSVKQGIPLTFGTVTREIDLCDTCQAKADTEIGGWLAQARRIIKTRGPYKKGAAAQPKKPKKLTVKKVTTRKRGKYPCPTCKDTFPSPQGRGAHRARAHGYRAKKR